MTKKRLTKQLLKNQICDTCIKKLAETCLYKNRFTCRKWNDYKIDELGILGVLMAPKTTKTIKFKDWHFIRMIKIYDLEGFKIGECDRRDFKVGPEDQIVINLHN